MTIKEACYSITDCSSAILLGGVGKLVGVEQTIRSACGYQFRRVRGVCVRRVVGMNISYVCVDCGSGGV